jgi:hypothetical protein
MKPSQPNRRPSAKRGGEAAKFELTRRAWSSQDLRAVRSVARRCARNRATSLLAKACSESHGAGRAEGEGHAGASQGAARNGALVESVAGAHPTEASRFQTRQRRKARLCEMRLRCHRSMEDVSDRHVPPHFHESGWRRRSRRFDRRLTVRRRTKGRIVRAATERQTGRPRVARREDNARAHTREAHARRSEPPIVPIQKRMGRREARHSSARGFRATRFDVRRHAEREVETSQDALSPADRNSFAFVHASGSIGYPF